MLPMHGVQTVLWVGCRRTDVPLYEALVTFDEALKTPAARTALRTDDFLPLPCRRLINVGGLIRQAKDF